MCRVDEPEQPADFQFSSRAGGVQVFGKASTEVPFQGACNCPRHSSVACAARGTEPQSTVVADTDGAESQNSVIATPPAGDVSDIFKKPFSEVALQAHETTPYDTARINFGSFDDGVSSSDSCEPGPTEDSVAINFDCDVVDSRPRLRRSVGVISPLGGGDVVPDLDAFDQVPQPPRRKSDPKLASDVFNALSADFTARLGGGAVE